MKRFFDALMVVGIFSLAFIIPVSLNRLTSIPSNEQAGYAQTEESQPYDETGDVKIPLDIPLPEGASLTDSKQQGMDSDLLTFSVPKTSLDKLQKYYNEEMSKLGWTKSSEEENSMEFHKEDGERRVRVTFIPSVVRPKLIMEITQNW